MGRLGCKKFWKSEFLVTSAALGVGAACPHAGHNLGSRGFGMGTRMLSSWKNGAPTKLAGPIRKEGQTPERIRKDLKALQGGPSSRILGFPSPAGLRDRLRVRFVQLTFEVVWGVRWREAAILNGKTNQKINTKQTNQPTPWMCSPAAPTLHPSRGPAQRGPWLGQPGSPDSKLRTHWLSRNQLESLSHAAVPKLSQVVGSLVTQSFPPPPPALSRKKVPLIKLLGPNVLKELGLKFL